MAQLKAGSTVGGVALLLTLKPSNLTGTAATTNQFLGVDANNDIKFLSSFYPQLLGTTNGYTSGGFVVGTSTYATRIDRFPFTAPFTTATNVGSLSQGRYNNGGQSSTTEGFTSGGVAAPGEVSLIDKFPFTAPFTTASTAGDLSQTRSLHKGNSSETDGYNAGPSGPLARVDNFPFSAPFTTATNLGNLGTLLSALAAHSFPTHGYVSGGLPSVPAPAGVVIKFPFSAPFAGGTNVGSLSQARYLLAGTSSALSGFSSGGETPTPTFTAYTTIDKFPFSAPFTSATSAGSLSPATTGAAGQSFTTSGYISGGTSTPSSPEFNSIVRFPFYAPFTTVTSAGSLSQARKGAASQQY